MAKPSASSTSPHRWRFYRAGGVDQVRLDRGADIVNLADLDQKLWVALSCPVKGLEFDERTLALLDTDNDGRVRAPEILAAVQWLGSVLKDPDILVKGEDGVSLAAIDGSTPEGKRMLASAKHILASLGRKDGAPITVGDATATSAFFAQARLNGDGVVPPEAIQDAATQKVATDLLACLGGVADRSGKQGFDKARVETFFAELQAHADWQAQSKPTDKQVFPLGDDTPAAFAALQAVQTKVDDYFGRCRLAAFDARATDTLRGDAKAFAEIAGKDLALDVVEVRALPLATIEPGKDLDLNQGVNPAWADAVAAFRSKAVAKILGKDTTSLSEAKWIELRQKLAGHAAWHAGKAGAKVEKLGVARVREILAGKHKDALFAAIDEDLGVAHEVDAITSVEKLVRYCRDLARLLNNYVSFTEFYARRSPAVFQAGTLYLDGRSCELCVRVADAGKHAAMAGLAKSYLAYCDLTRSTGEKMTVAAAFTAGDSDHLMVGRNGIFYDRAGRDWDATITKIVDNPISIRQAFWAPYKKALRWIEEQIAKRAAAADAASTDKLTGAAGAVGDAAATGKAAEPKKFDPSVVALFSVAISGIAGVLGTIVAVFAGMGPWVPLGILGVMLGISGPSMLIAFMKLRQRNLGPILDANGWAVNGRVKVNIPLGASLTDTPTLPKGSERSLVDPYAPKRSIWPRLAFVLVLLGGVWIGLHKTGVAQKWDWYKTTWEKYFPPATDTQNATEKK